MAHPTHHYSLHRRFSRRKATKTIDKLAYVIGIGGNIAVIPQVIKAWQSAAPGLAISTWMTFTAIGFIWLAYAILHKQKPLILAQVVGISCNMLVISGWIVNNMLTRS